MWYDPSTFQADWRRNLLTYTEQFDNAVWRVNTPHTVVATNVVVAPDGTTTADKLICGSGGSNQYSLVSITVQDIEYTFSVYAKSAGEGRYLGLIGFGLSDAGEAPVFNLDAGTVDVPVTTTIFKSASISSVGAGWYRCSVTLVSSAGATLVGFGVCNSTTDNTISGYNYVGDNTSGVYIWGAQLERSSSATSYQKITDGVQDYLTADPNPVLFQDSSGTTPVSAVEQPVGLVLDKSGRGNHDSQSTAAKRPVLSARYNLLTYSEDFSNAYWQTNNITYPSSAEISPIGTTTAYLAQETAAAGTHYVFPLSTTGPACTNGVSYTSSFCLKKGNGASAPDVIQLAFALAQWGANAYANFSFTTGTFTYVGSGITAQSAVNLGGGWFRVTLTALCTTTVANCASVGFIFCDNNPTAARLPSYTGATGSNVYIWGADFRLANDGVGLPTYQRINAATDYDTGGFPLYLKFDGVDDALQTSTIDFTGTDKMTVFAGFNTNSTSQQVLSELGNLLSDTNSLSIQAVGSVSGKMRYIAYGTTGGFVVESSPTYTAPVSLVVSDDMNLASSTSEVAQIVRVNASAISTSPVTGSAATGDFGNRTIYVGARAVTSLYLSGRIYFLIIRGADTSNAQIINTEIY